LLQPEYITYKTADELVVYTKMTKQTLLLPIVADAILKQLQQHFPDWCHLSPLPGESTESVKEVVNLLVQSGLIEARE
jgi:hypothetical protein